MSAVTVTELPLPLFRRGKVRDVYEAGADTLLMVASDRVSAFDCVLPQPIPRKGEVLTMLTAWWLERLDAAHPHHLLTVDPVEIAERVPALGGGSHSRPNSDLDPASGPASDAADPGCAHWARRSMLVRRTEPIPIECVVRGYLAGSAWKEYRSAGTLAGEPLPEGLVESSRLEPPIFSPATKADVGDHDENITYREVAERVGSELATSLRERSLRMYEAGARVASERGVLLADTKYEFGRLPDGTVLLIDEIMTPDSSRYWPTENYEPGRSQPSLDKQPIRDWLDALEDWDKTPPPPDLPAHVVEAATDRYLEIFRRLTGKELDDFRSAGFAEGL